MLNYVWLALLFLGIGAAISTDIYNQSENKFRNNEQLPVTVVFPSKVENNKEKTYQAELEIKAAEFNKFYGDTLKSNIQVPAKITIHSGNQKSSLYFKIEKTAPAIWHQIASASGDKDDISGTVSLSGFSSDSIATGAITLEEVSF